MGMDAEWRKRACGSEEGSRESPFPVPPRGTRGRVGSPHAAVERRLPPQEGPRPPLCHPPGRTIKNFLDTGRPSHGSRKRKRAYATPNLTFAPQPFVNTPQQHKSHSETRCVEVFWITGTPAAIAQKRECRKWKAPASQPERAWSRRLRRAGS